MSDPIYHIYPCGDHAATIELGKTVDMATNQRVLALFTYLKESAIDGVRDVIPAYHTVTVVYDIALLLKKTKKGTVYEYVCAWIEQSLANIHIAATAATKPVTIPVCYHNSLGPDLASLAALHNISEQDVIDLHTANTYRVYMIGFLPGFAYMGSVHPSLVTPRRQQPRISVPAGSVGIAGEQTGIYPFASPGGWQLIGQTPVIMFRTDSDHGCYLQPGDEVRFVPISIDEFHNWQQ